MEVKDRNNFYIGETNQMLREGFGVYIYENKFFKYEGEWQNGKKHGHGRFVMADGSFYEGEFLNGEICGKGERYWSKTGNVYRGEFYNGEMTGTGIMFYGNGDEYRGDWNCNCREGNGQLIYANGDVYEGEFYKHKIHGEGIMRLVNGSIYTGYWICGNKHGHGKMTMPDGSVYEGQFHYNLFQGEGTLFHICGTLYTGLWEHNLPCKVPTKMALTTDILDCFQGHIFKIILTIITASGEIVHEESGRQLRMSAGMKYQPVTDNNSLFELIEQIDIHPVETIYYPVLLVPLTDKPPLWVTNLENVSPHKARLPELFDSSSSDTNTQPSDQTESGIKDATFHDDLCSDPVIQETKNGSVDFDNLFIQRPKISSSSSFQSENATEITNLTSIGSTSNKQNKDQLLSEEKNSKLKQLGDEKFTKPGEYVLIIEDITENPFMNNRLETFYTKIHIHPFPLSDSLQTPNPKDSQKRRRSEFNSENQIFESQQISQVKNPNSRRSSDLF